MQGYCPSRSAVAKFRGEAVYLEFMKQWNIGVYFSLRYLAQASHLSSFTNVQSTTFDISKMGRHR